MPEDRDLTGLIDVELADAERRFDRVKKRFLDGVTDDASLVQRRRFLRLFENLLSDMHEARRRLSPTRAGEMMVRSAMRRLAS